MDSLIEDATPPSIKTFHPNELKEPSFSAARDIDEMTFENPSF